MQRLEIVCICQDGHLQCNRFGEQCEDHEMVMMMMCGVADAVRYEVGESESAHS